MNPDPTPAKISSSTRSWKRALLAGTCVGTATLAQAQVFNESTDFGGTVGGAVSSPLPNGTTTVNGTVTLGTDPSDFFAFSGLVSGFAFSITLTLSGQATFDVLDSSGTHVGSPAGPVLGASVTFTGTVPPDGKLVASVGYNEGFAYTVNLTSNVPEPETTAMVVLGVAGVAGVAMSRMQRSKGSK